jgi:hypothetical protein
MKTYFAYGCNVKKSLIISGLCKYILLILYQDFRCNYFNLVIY